MIHTYTGAHEDFVKQTGMARFLTIKSTVLFCGINFTWLYLVYIFRVALFIFIFCGLEGRAACALAACATYEALHLRFASDVESAFTKYLIQNSRIPGPGSDRCPGASHGPCLFACSTSLPAPFRVVSTWYSHKRDQPNSARCCCRRDVLLRTQPKNTNHNA